MRLLRTMAAALGLLTLSACVVVSRTDCHHGQHGYHPVPPSHGSDDGPRPPRP